MSARRMKVGKIANRGLNSEKYARYRINGKRAGRTGESFDGEERTDS